MTSRRSHRWVFTLNNPTLADNPNAWNAMLFVHWQLEAGPSGTPHLQGTICWKESLSLGSVRKRCPRAHWEVMRGSLDQSIAYCSKKESRLKGPWSAGHKPQPGRRNDLWDVKALIDAGQSDTFIADGHFPAYAKFYKAFAHYRLMHTKQRNERPTIFVLWGKSGTGKTRMVAECFPEAYWKPKSKWWDGYTGQEVVIFDEFYSWIPLDELLRVLDWYPLQLEIKGGSVMMTTSVFVFTSNVDPMDWYAKLPMFRRKALHRRFKEFGTIVKF